MALHDWNENPGYALTTFAAKHESTAESAPAQLPCKAVDVHPFKILLLTSQLLWTPRKQKADCENVTAAAGKRFTVLRTLLCTSLAFQQICLLTKVNKKHVQCKCIYSLPLFFANSSFPFKTYDWQSTQTKEVEPIPVVTKFINFTMSLQFRTKLQ